MKWLRKKKKQVSKKSEHIRWNSEESHDYSRSIRCHIVVVGGEDRKNTMMRILGEMRQLGSTLIPIRQNRQGDVKGTNFGYLLETYDTRSSLVESFFKKFGKPVERDDNLREDVGGGIEDYVADFYER